MNRERYGHGRMLRQKPEYCFRDLYRLHTVEDKQNDPFDRHSLTGLGVIYRYDCALSDLQSYRAAVTQCLGISRTRRPKP